MLRLASLLLFGLLLLSPSSAAWGQQLTALGGIGNSLGWLGAQLERTTTSGRIGGFVGLGYIPEIDEGDPKGPALAAGLRGYTRGRVHRGFLEAAVAVVALQAGGAPVLGTVESKKLYGPTIQAGYRLTTGGGFSLLVSGGVGVAVGASTLVADSSLQPVFGLGLGYAWR
ncbi:MAG: hypothetical protein AB7R55_16800 [Gemmatimonadales bacterium]